MKTFGFQTDITMQKNDLIGSRDGCGCSERVQNDCCARGASEVPRYVKCGCGEPQREPSWGLRGHPLACVYSVLQDWQEIYDLDTAHKRGTIFKELDLPFYGGCCASGDGRLGEYRCNDNKCGGGRNGR